MTIFVVFKMTDIASENQESINSLIGNNIDESNAKFITFFNFKTCTGGLGIIIETLSNRTRS